MADTDRQDGHETLNPAALGAADVARLLGVPVAVVEQHLAEGAPQATGGRMNLVHYAAWLLNATAEDTRRCADGH